MSIYRPASRFMTVKAYYSLDFTSYTMEAHRHQRCEIMYVLNGQCTIQVESAQYLLKPGQFVFIDENILHSLYVQKGVPCSVLNLELMCQPQGDGVDLHHLAVALQVFNAFLDKPQSFWLLHDTGNLCYVLKDLLLELENKTGLPDRQFILNLLLTRVLLELSRCAANNVSAAGICYVKKAQEYIKENVDGELNVPLIAKYVGIHRTYLQKLFKQYLHCGVTEYINHLKLQKAAYFLQNSFKSITEIAYEAGFNSRQHFSYTFEKQFKISPKKYREKNAFYKSVNTNRMKRIEK